MQPVSLGSAVEPQRRWSFLERRAIIPNQRSSRWLVPSSECRDGISASLLSLLDRLMSETWPGASSRSDVVSASFVNHWNAPRRGSVYPRHSRHKEPTSHSALPSQTPFEL